MDIDELADGLEMIDATWLTQLKHNPLPELCSSGDEALVYFTRRDLLGEDPGPVTQLWELPEAERILRKQLDDGSWPWAGSDKHPAINHRLIETWRQLRLLAEQYGFTREHPAISMAAEYLFGTQTEQGDFRGMLANQYATYYTGAIMATLIHLGYADDERVEKGFRWLLAMRQADGGWTIPLLTHKLDRATQYRLTSEYAKPLEPDRSKPFSHNWTGMVLRAFAAHPLWRRSQAALHAAQLMKSRIFRPDAYTSYHAASYWIRFEYPFWWNNLVSALDSLSLIGIPSQDKCVRGGLAWLFKHQEKRGTWKSSYVLPMRRETSKACAMKLWITLAICRIIKRWA